MKADSIRIGVEATIQGRYRPNRVFVLSMAQPMKGSKVMSISRTIMNTAATAPSSSPT